MKSHMLLDPGISTSQYFRVDLSITNDTLGDALKDPESCQAYLDRVLEKHKKRVAFGGYLERRGLYDGFGHFNPGESGKREYHLGVDFWAPAGTSVHTPWKGRVHSWANRTARGDYGPVLLLEHLIYGKPLYSVYGHLSSGSLDGLFKGREFEMGQEVGRLGTASENGGYAPHLHFQFVRDLEGYSGDYPGVCALEQLEFYRENCPDPLDYLNFSQ
ncbi:peptidoglycan DD-metalloendopeptidase family protein [Robiginitalea sp.]|uniref:peptidoglycan DD-metalloendopeptidase family protein n=1 Tax=Robiginitalea sp. TaxID=1902411 RepID=UPI003C3C6B8B